MNWSIMELGDLAEFRNGINYNQTNFGTGIKVIGVVNFQNYIKPRYNELEEVNPEGVVKDEDILLDDDILFVRSNGNKDLIGRSLFIESPPEPITFSGFCIRTRFTSNQVFPRFFAYLFRSDLIRQTLSAYGGGTNIANLNQKILSRLQVPLPPLPTQQRIAEILSTYDRLIDNNNRRIALLEESIHQLYKEWFVRSRFPGYESVKVVDGIPEGWNMGYLPNLCSKLMDGTHDSPKPTDDGYYLVTGKHIVNGFIDFSKCYFISPEEHQKVMKRSHPEKGDIIFSNIGTLGSIALVDQDFEFSIKNVALFKPLKKVYSSFLYIYLSNINTLTSMSQKASGTSQKFFSLKFLRNSDILIPPDDIIIQFDNFARPILEQRSLLNKNNQKLKEARDLLLPRLINGSIAV